MGSALCIHGKYKAACNQCGGSSLCLNCRTWTDARYGLKRYDKHCATCFKRLFPDDPRSIKPYEHSKELRVRNAINQNFDGFIHDRPLYTGDCDCTHRRRIDHYKVIGNTILAIETDEFAHKSYNPKDEEMRYHDLEMVFGGKWIFIRFNPDPTVNDHTDLEDRIEALIDEIQKQLDRIEQEENGELLEVIKMYYD